MFRIRAVESPPDAAGARRIWHRGVRGAELVTVVDGKGQVVQQELTLFGELWRWEHPGGFRGVGLEAEALARLSLAIDAYAGADRFLHHLRDQLAAHARGAPVAARPSSAPGEPDAGPAVADPVAGPGARRWVLAVVIGGALLAAVALAALWGR
jgi:hypothetical protein